MKTLNTLHCFWFVCLFFCFIVSVAHAQNHVLSLDGDGDYVELADSESLNAINSQVTMEAWIKATAFPNQWHFILFKGDKRTSNACENRSYGLCLNSSGFIHLFSAPSGKGQAYLNSPSGSIALNRWHHVAGIIDAKSGVMKIVLNGVEVARQNFGKDIHVSILPLRIGSSHEEEVQEHSPFAGQIDEVRIWNIARTEEEIHRTMDATLSGKESGLVGYWRFEDDEEIATDSSPNHADGKLMGNAHIAEIELPKPGELAISTVISGIITDEANQPIPNVFVCLEQDSSEIAQTRTDDSGSYRIVLFQPVRGPYNLSVTTGNLGDWRLGIRLRERERRKLDLTLKEAISISGTVLVSDNAASQVNVPVHAVALDRGDPPGRPKIIVTTLSDEQGKYLFINLKPGRYQVWCKIPGGDVYYGEEKDTAPTLRVERGKTVPNIDLRFVPFKKRTQKADALTPGPSPSGRGVGGEGSPTTIPPLRPLFEAQTYTTRVGADAMRSAVTDAQGYTWFSTVEQGMTHFYRFDGKRFTGIGNTIGSGFKRYARDAEGKVWMAGQNGVVRLWNGEVEKYYTVKDGLPSNAVIDLQADKHKGVWVMTTGGISYIHKENGNYKMSLVVDSTMLNLSGIEVDSASGVWWWATGPLDVTTIVHRLLKTPQDISEVLKIQLSFKVETAKAVGEGLLLKGENSPFIYYRADGIGQPLDSHLSRYFGTDAKGRLYFAAEAGDGLMQIIRGELDNEGNFGYPGSPLRFEFPMELSTGYNYWHKFKNEMWMFNWTADKPVFVIKENDIFPGKDLYLSNLMGGGYFMIIDDETVWAREWGKREVTELRFFKGVEYEVCDLNPNGLRAVQYNCKTGSYYFILHPGFSSPGPGVFSLVSYHNREWKKLLKFKSSWPSFQTDAGGNTWLADFAEDSARLICITDDGNIEQQLIKFKEFSPDNNGGCYLLDSDGTLIYYKEKKLTIYPLPGIKNTRNIAALSDGSVYIQTGNALYRRTPETLRQLTTKDGLPADSPARIWKSGSKLFFYTPGQIGWIEDGIVSLVDTRRYPQLKDVTTAQQDEAGRIFFYGAPNEAPIREIWMLEGETLKKLPLPDSFNSRDFTLFLENDEVALIASGKIYRYSQEHYQFHLLKNTGTFVGYIWGRGGYITEGSLIVSGWGKRFLKIDLKNAPPTVPQLRFQSISIDKKNVDKQSRYTLPAGSEFKASYIAIEKFSQTNVFSQTRLVGLDEAWSEPTQNESVEFRNLPAGAYRLEIRAKGESELWGTPIGFDIEVMPPWYMKTAFLAPTVSLGTILLVTLTVLSIGFFKRRRQVHAYQQAAVAELRDAREMQMSLLPQSTPQIEGFDIAGACEPATDVGGDYFTYLWMDEAKTQLGIVLMDVTGHGMKAATTTFLANGMLQSESRNGATPGEIMANMHRSLQGILPKQAFVAMAFALVNLHDKTPDGLGTQSSLTYFNAGLPEPLLLRGGEPVELPIQSDVPLGCRLPAEYVGTTVPLRSGDVLLLFSDGLPEATSVHEQMYEESRLGVLLDSLTAQPQPAQAWMDAILTDARAFTDPNELEDDLTAVVVRVL